MKLSPLLLGKLRDEEKYDLRKLKKMKQQELAKAEKKSREEWLKECEALLPF